MKNFLEVALKHRMMLDYGPVCERCGKRGAVDLHHIVNKGRVMNNAEAAVMIHVPELVALLCADCHIGTDNAHGESVRRELLSLKVKRHGRERVQAALDRVQSHMTTTLDIELEGNND